MTIDGVLLPRFSRAAMIAVASALAPSVHAQHEHEAEGRSGAGTHAGLHGSMIFAGIPHTREASGTAWQPDATPMHAWHARLDEWSVMAHFNIFAAYDRQWGPRGDDQFNSINWVMLMAQRPLGERADFMLRTMLTLEPATTTAHGYPLLFQSGEAFHGEGLVDRQHPHDLFMELAARWRFQLAEKTAVSLYLGAPGEPPLGPPAFMHRASAMENPAAPISHHWLDSTHITYGVVTLGLSHDVWQLEGSVFNGREPDEDRWGIDTIHFDSWAARLSWNPTPHWSAQFSHGWLRTPEELHPDESLRRTTASVMYQAPLGRIGPLATTLAWGMNDAESGLRSHAILLESNLGLTSGFNVFGRAEHVQKPGEELALEPEHRKFGITQLTLGVSRELTPGRPYSIAAGASVSYTFKPSSLNEEYGDHPVGLWVFFRIRPAEMAHGAPAGK